MKKEVKAQSVRDKETEVRAQSVRDKETVIRAQSVKGTESQTRVKGQGNQFMQKTSPGQRIGRTTRKTSCKKLDITQVFSIVDTEFEQRSNNQYNQLYRSESGEITW